MMLTEPALVAVIVLGLVSVAAGVAVFVVDSMAKATFALLVSFLAVAGILLALELTYLALITALMMTIEMAIMAVFMIMFMMNPAGLMPMTMVHNKRASVAAGVVVFAVLVLGIWTIDWPDRTGGLPVDSTRQIGAAIMGSHMLVMLVIGIGLFATIISGTVLATHRGRYDRFGANLRPLASDEPTPDDPADGGMQ